MRLVEDFNNVEPLFFPGLHSCQATKGHSCPAYKFPQRKQLDSSEPQAQHPRIFHESTATFKASNKKGAPFVADLQCLVAFKILSQMSKDFLDPKCPFEMKVIYQL